MAEIDDLFQRLIEEDGSDLHLSPGRRPMIRQSGDMQPLEPFPLLPGDIVEQLVSEILPERNARELKDKGETDFAYEVTSLARLRVNVFHERMGTGAVFRVIPTKILTAEQLDLPESVTQFCYLNKGLVVVTGPTGSGKSTTMAAMLDFINKRQAQHIITIEDPIEFVHQDIKCLVNQREVNAHTQSFANALRAALREDPDIVLLGEMRDLITIETAIETAETGHLVFGTLHTNTAASTVDRIIDSFPADRQNQIRAMLSTSLKGAVSQTLCKKKEGRGRVAALEVMVVTRSISALIRDGKTYQIPQVMQVGSSDGMIMLNESLLRLVRDEVVTPEEAFVKAVDKDELLQRFKKAGMPAPQLSHDEVPE